MTAGVFRPAVGRGQDGFGGLRRHTMSNLQRRDFLTGTAAVAASAVLLAARTAEAGDPSFMNNVPDPLLSGKNLPTFKFALEKSKAKVIGKSTAREATVEEFPISKGSPG